MSSLKVAVYTLGCRANQADSATLVGLLDRSVVAVVGMDDAPHVVVINTCCVTAEAERDCRKAVRRAQRVNGDVKVVLTGCAVSAFADFAAEFKDGNVTTFGSGKTPPRDLANWLVQLAEDRPSEPTLGEAHSKRYFDEADPHTEFGNVDGRTRGLLKIQNGCNHNCSYCIVPRARGSEQSMSEAQVLTGAAQLKTSGFQELVLTGVQIGAWGKDLPGTPSLADLLLRVADAFAPGRVRLGSIEPWAVTDALAAAIGGHDRICPHLHIPLQSGDDRVLSDMKRGYTASQYMEIVANARSRIAGLALGMDVLAGFPTEDVAAFENTLSVVREVRPAYLHGFPYSSRRYTAAAKMTSVCSREEAKKRARDLTLLSGVLSQEYRRKRVGGVAEVLVEEHRRGMTEDYLSVAIDGGIKGELLRARLLEDTHDGDMLRVEIVDSFDLKGN